MIDIMEFNGIAVAGVRCQPAQQLSDGAEIDARQT